jgi:hypothetical protein
VDRPLWKDLGLSFRLFWLICRSSLGSDPLLVLQAVPLLFDVGPFMFDAGPFVV